VQRPLLLALELAILLLMIGAASAVPGGFNILVEDSRLKVRLTYPPEVEIGSCFNVQIEVTALSALEDLNLRLKVTYFYDAGSQVLYDQLLIDTLDVAGPQVVLLKNIVLCIPSPVRIDPFLEARLTTSYTIDTTTIELTNTFYLSTVRQISYERLSSMLASANQEVSRLRAEVDRLRSELGRLEARLQDAASREEQLKADLQALTLENQRLRDKIAELQTLSEALGRQLSALNDRYTALLKDYSALDERNKSLMDSYLALQKSFEELRRDYEAVSRDLTSMRSMYSDLQARHEGLRSSYEGAVKTIGELQGRLGEVERQKGVLEGMLSQALGESGFLRNVAVAQGVGIAALGGGLGLWAITRRRRRPPAPSTAPQPPPSQPSSPQPQANPPSTTALTEGEEVVAQESSEEAVQKVISGRRVTIPSRLAERLGLSIGDHVKISLLGERIVLTPIRANGLAGPQPAEPVSQLQHSSGIQTSRTQSG
jgi:predicted nuclease with TOPRIM domain/bifunctional DNA-binding transcriptional regulator/antitoxin component of YhaV-PrlF toxin-antitoxin module